MKFEVVAVGDHDVRTVLVAAVSGVEPAVLERFRRFLGLAPVALEHVVGAGQHLALGHERDDDHGLGLERRARNLDRSVVEVGIVREHGLAMVDRPAGEVVDDRDDKAAVIHA